VTYRQRFVATRRRQNGARWRGNRNRVTRHLNVPCRQSWDPRAGLPLLAGPRGSPKGWRSEALLYYKCDTVQISGSSEADRSV